MQRGGPVAFKEQKRAITVELDRGNFSVRITREKEILLLLSSRWKESSKSATTTTTTTRRRRNASECRGETRSSPRDSSPDEKMVENFGRERRRRGGNLLPGTVD